MHRPFGFQLIAELLHAFDQLRFPVGDAGYKITPVVLDGYDVLHARKWRTVDEDLPRQNVQLAQHAIQRLIEIVNGTGGDQDVGSGSHCEAWGEFDPGFVPLGGQRFAEFLFFRQIKNLPLKVRRETEAGRVAVKKISDVSSQVEYSPVVGRGWREKEQHWIIAFAQTAGDRGMELDFVGVDVALQAVMSRERFRLSEGGESPLETKHRVQNWFKDSGAAQLFKE